MKVPLSLYQLLGISCLFLASKYCEPKSTRPNISFFAEITGGDITMECEILNGLNWNCNDPIPSLFLVEFLSRLKCVSKKDSELLWKYSNCFVEKIFYGFVD
ncbi:hypothetical protein HK096_008830 [Nowakowskiella sp. JEL0078]|nr:hypothetical protein HK096_008830 [Nowakowskiella sp. JEL0078]